MKIFELFDSGQAINVEPDTDGYVGQFNVGGTEYFIAFDNIGKDRYEISFGRENPGLGRSRFAPVRDSSNGGALEVYSTIIATIERFTRQHYPNVLQFSGKIKQGLGQVYLKLVRKVGNKLIDMGYELEQYNKNGNEIFIFRKISEENLDEAFNTTTPVDWIKWGGDEFVGRFKVNDQLFEIEFTESSPGIWKLYYGAKTNGADEDPQFSPTGTSGTKAIHVLSAVVNIVLEFIQQQQPKLLRFSGSKAAGLGDLYQRMAKHLEPKLNAIGYHMDNKDSGAQNFFGIRKGLKNENN